MTDGLRLAPSLPRLSTLAALVLLAAACGGASPPSISVQPTDARVFEGQTAVFEVVAAGADGYQWNRNGQPIPGATAARLVTGPTTPADAASIYSVVVSHEGDGVTSRGARLDVDSPLDLRFKWAGAPYQPNWAGNGLVFASSGMGMKSTYAGVGSPLGTEGCSPLSGTCTWVFAVGPPSEGFTTTYEASLIADLAPGWAAGLGPDAVVTTLDFEEATGLYATSVIRTTQAGAFTPVNEGDVDPAGLQALATSEAAAGRVITAVSYRGGRVAFVSHGWSRAGSATYEARVVTAQYADLSHAAWTLSSEGYVITAAGAGAGGENGFILVGTRLTGETRPRSLLLAGNVEQTQDHALVAILFDTASPSALLIGQQ